MVDQRKTEIKVGIVSLVGIGLLVIGLILAKGCNVNVSNQTVKFRFPNSGGLSLSNPVVVNGVKRGYVTSIQNNNGSVLVEATIDNMSDIYSDASGIISILEITGGKKIELNPGKSGIAFNVINEIPGKTGKDLADLVYIIGDMSDDLVRVFHRLDTMTTKLSDIVSAEGFTDKVLNIVNNTDILISDAKNLLNRNLDEINAIISDINELTGNLKKDYKKYEPKLDSLLTKLDVTLLSADKLLGKLDTTMSSANGMLADAKDITGEIKGGKGLVSRMIYDKNFSTKLDSTIVNVDKLINMLLEYGVKVRVRL